MATDKTLALRAMQPVERMVVSADQARARSRLANQKRYMAGMSALAKRAPDRTK